MIYQMNNLIDKIIEEYVSDDILTDSDELHRLKEAIRSLTDIEQTILILYADTGSLRKTSKILHVCDYMIWSAVQKIRRKIKTILEC